jgi:anaerobic magnesium-protoporphyrin IX monomethyl ester cyclase
MRTILIGINAKYIHTNLAIRLLKANTFYPVDIKEFTIKDDINQITQYILEHDYDLVGFSCYIWNIELVKKIIHLLKEKKPSILILLGGPEVSYNTLYFFRHFPIDYIIRNEGEKAFNQLLEALDKNLALTHIKNLATREFANAIEEIDTAVIKSPHYLDNDYANRIIYIETSRGCPFHCSYCMASLEKKVRFFDLETVKTELLYLMSKGAKTFKFLDRTFNTDLKRAYDLFGFIIKNHYPHTSFQFEITGDLLSEEIITFLNQNAPKDLFRFEIGIQSTNPLTNELVYRHQNQERLFNNITKIQEGNIIDLHLDLIAGLPKEDLTSFAKTFNDVLSLRPLELQLGFLKMLKGTKIFEEAPLYQYRFMDTAPYEILENDVLTVDDIKKIKTVENVLEKYYNSHFMVKTITYLLDHEDSAFHFFLAYGEAYEKNYSWLNYNLDDLFLRLYQYLASIKYPEIDYILFLMKQDYLSHFNLRPKIWWPKLDKKTKNEIIKKIKKIDNYSLDDLYKYALIEVYRDQYLIAIFKDKTHELLIIEKQALENF